MHKFFNCHLNFFNYKNILKKHIYILLKTINKYLVIIITPLNNYKNWLRKRLWSMMYFAIKKKKKE
jgi:hypothetical protein